MSAIARKRPNYPAKPDRSSEFASYAPRQVNHAKLRQTARMATAQDTYLPSVAAPKDGRFDSVAWRRAVASLPCVLCKREGDTQCAHRNQGKGMARRTDDVFTAALCTRCHSEIDSGNGLTRDERRERMDRAILLTYRALAMAGRLTAA